MVFHESRAKPKGENLRVRQFVRLISPSELKLLLPANEAISMFVAESRESIVKILDKEDNRLLVIAGPCSIHNEKGALDYAKLLSSMRKELADRMEIIMRVYFEKPRTTIGWKGMINDPRMDGSQDIEAGLKSARRILLEINKMDLPAATEFLDPIVPQYTADLVSWAAIGARTTESQTHREMASGLSMPVGMKNGTDGNIQTAIDAMLAARQGHSFLGINDHGMTSIVRTTGNPYVHLVLRGGGNRTNYDSESIHVAEKKLRSEKMPQVLVVDCSHANSGKQHAQQERVWKTVIEQRANGTSPSIIGLMVESNIHEGAQPIPKNLADLRYGVSVTDPCISWETTEKMLRWAYERL